jgi:uncharacterized protein
MILAQPLVHRLIMPTCLDVGMQMVERPWGVTAYGAASVQSKPDLVRARFKVSRTEQGPSEAFAAAGEAVGAVRQALREHGISDSAVQQSRLDLRTAWTFTTERRFAGYQCEASFSVESRELENLQPLLVALVAAGANEIDGVGFDVLGKADLRAEARRQAVAAARRKAELYAEAAGVRLGAVLHIEDVDPEQLDDGYRQRELSTDSSSADFAPGQVIVSAAVILGFGINHD